LSKLLLEAFYSTFGIDDLLLTRIVRMALRAHINFEIFAGGTSGFKGISAAADN
jgi:hypothetical protein